MRATAVWLAWAVLVGAAFGGEVGFLEDFALAPDRAVPLRQLIPGTEDYYYYHALHYLNTGQFDKAEDVTRPWLARFGQTPRLTEIQGRHALLTYDRNPQKSLAYLRQHLGLHFDHQRPLDGAPDLPTALDPQLIARPTLRIRALARTGNLDGFEDTALEGLAAADLGWERRRNLLQRLQLPDVPGLVRLIADDLEAPNPVEFGAYAIHRQLTPAQLDELLKLRPELLNHTAFVQTYLRKIRPGADEDWQHDRAAMQAYLDRLWAFVGRLAPAHNSLKAHVLNHRLAFDRSQGVYDQGRFLTYLQLPRHQAYVAPAMLQDAEARGTPADLQANFLELTGLLPVMEDFALVRDYLRHFLAAADGWQAFAPYVNDVLLKALFATVKMENGLGDAERWAALLSPEEFRQFQGRVDLDFAPTNRTEFAADEAVRLDVFVKNVPRLLVRIYEINPANYYRTRQQEVDPTVNLDGLTASVEQTHQYDDPPGRRVARRFELPQLSRPGVYVVDFLGNGLRSRAVIAKGRLHPLVTTGTAGQVVTVVDEARRPVKDATLWLGGQEYRPDAAGRIIVPFSTQPGRRPIVLSRGAFASLAQLDHEAEAYALKAGIHVEAEALLAGRTAAVLVRAGLYLNGRPVPLKLLEDVRLRIHAENLDGIPTETEVADFKVSEGGEAVHRFTVPARLQELHVSLHARVKSLSRNQTVDLESAQSFAVNDIDRVARTLDLHLARFGPDYVIEARGKTGEARPDQAVLVELKHRDFKEPVRVNLKSDARGRILLGPLPDVVKVTATGPGMDIRTRWGPRSWNLPSGSASFPSTLHARAGEIITLPFLGNAGRAAREELALFELRGGEIAVDRFDALELQPGALAIRGLAPGNYALHLKRHGVRITLAVVDGPVVNGFVLGKVRHLELPQLPPVKLASVKTDAETLTVQLRDASPLARVHVFATRYKPAFLAHGDLGRVGPGSLESLEAAATESTYLPGQLIGDELRYILERRAQKKYPGNMLERPGLLLNPWAVGPTENAEQEALEKRAKDDGRGMGEGAGSGVGKASRRSVRESSTNLDFLADAAAVLTNLRPDKDGLVRVPRKDLGPYALIQVVAVDPVSTASQIVALPEQPAKFLDLRLQKGLDPAGHFLMQQQVSLLTQGQPFTLTEADGARLQLYDSLARVHRLYVTLSDNADLAGDFAFLVNWPNLKPEEQRRLYSKFACHELHFFLYRKDPAFFRAVVRPYLANKKDKTFLDRWLLDEDLGSYLQPWPYAQLNTVERILLGQRLPGETARTARHLQDVLSLRPVDPVRTQRLFETAIQGRALRVGEVVIVGNTVTKENVTKHAEAKPDAKGERTPVMAPVLPPRPPASTPPSDAPADKAPEPAKAEAEPEGKEVDGKRKKRWGDAEYKKDSMASPSIDKDGDPDLKLPDLVPDMPEPDKGGIEAPPDAIDKLRRDDRPNAKVRQLYRQVEPPQELAENTYYHLPIQKQTADLVPVNTFWRDYARHDGKGPFLSPHLAEAAGSFTEMVLALAVLDLPFTAPKHEVAQKDGARVLTPGGPAVLFHEAIRRVEDAPGKPPVLVSQNFFRSDDRYRMQDGDKLDKFISGEFLTQTIYGGQVVVTNPGAGRLRLSLLIQLPVGALPVARGQATQTVPLDLEPYRTQAVEYLFYFPQSGKFAQYPAHVGRHDQLVAAAAPATFTVVEKLARPDTGAWDYVAQHGTNEEVLAFLGRENVQALDLDRLAFRMKDRAFFEAALRLLRERHVYHPTLWSYALNHDDPAAARQYLAFQDPFLAQLGGPLASPLLTIDPVARRQYEHLEYKPLVNARAHALGQRRQIVDPKVHEQYHRFLTQLAYRPQLTAEDRLAATYYLLLQDRIDEALAAFAQVPAEAVAERIQYDYCACYLQLFSDEPARARALAQRYATYPVDRWRQRFQAVLDQLNEAEKGPQVADADDRGQRQDRLAATEPGVEFTLDGAQIQLTWQQVTAARINYYPMDVELLFSGNPFVRQVSGPFALIRPAATQEVQLPAGQAKLAVPLPPDLARRNVLVEVTAAGKTRAQPYFAAAMDVKVQENYGQLRVTDPANGQALPKVYVKVYARLADGRVKFHKDGYTDHRGRFDYATVSTPAPDAIGRFAVLVLSEERGAAIREVNPPQQ